MCKLRAGANWSWDEAGLAMTAAEVALIRGEHSRTFQELL